MSRAIRCADERILVGKALYVPCYARVDAVEGTLHPRARERQEAGFVPLA